MLDHSLLNCPCNNMEQGVAFIWEVNPMLEISLKTKLGSKFMGALNDGYLWHACLSLGKYDFSFVI